MRTIWKFEVNPPGLIEMPKGSIILHAAFQNKALKVWVLVDPVQNRVTRKINVYGTGHNIPEGAGKFISTVFEGPFVWHIFAGEEK